MELRSELPCGAAFVLSAEGQADVAIAAALAVSRPTVILWRKRFAEQGGKGLWKIAPGRGRKPI